jgi:hypothetical protein
MYLFRLNTWVLTLIIFVLMFATATIAFECGRRLRHRSDRLREPYAVLQASLFGVVALILAFGLALAVGRYDARRAAVVDDANAIGTTYLRAQTLPEPERTESLELLRRYADTSIRLANSVPASAAFDAAAADGHEAQRALWALAGEALDQSPEGSAVRLYVESLNEMIDQETVRTSALNNRVPDAVLALEALAAASAVALLAFLLALLGRGIGPALIAATLVALLLLVTFDLDRPTRGTIKVPDKPLTDLRTSMEEPPAAAAPTNP